MTGGPQPLAPPRDVFQVVRLRCSAESLTNRTDEQMALYGQMLAKEARVLTEETGG